MRYIDVTTGTLTQNLLAVDLRFKVTSDSLIRISNNMTQNLSGVSTLDQAMNVLDNFSGNSGSLTLLDEDGVETPNITKIVFDEVIVTGVNEATVSLDGNLDRVVQNINDGTVIYEGVPSLVHEFIHNLDTEFFKFDIWVEEDIGWQNSIVPITIIDNNTVRVNLTEERSVRIILSDINNISKTYGI